MKDQTQPGPTDIVQLSIARLNTERDMLVKLPTWPWRAGMVTGFLPMLLPAVNLLSSFCAGSLA